MSSQTTVYFHSCRAWYGETQGDLSNGNGVCAPGQQHPDIDRARCFLLWSACVGESSPRLVSSWR